MKKSGYLTIIVLMSFAMAGCKNKQAASDIPDVPPPLAYDNEPTAMFDVGEPADAGHVISESDVVSVEPAPQPQPAVRQHVVVKNDRLWKLAVRYYGDGQRWKDIADANNIPDPKRLAIGTKLIIPE